MNQVIYVHIPGQAKGSHKGVVGHARDVHQTKVMLPKPGRYLRRFEELGEVMGALR